MTIVGGRNIADEYYETGGATEFIDEDLLAIGPPVDEISDGFDEYWNSPEAMPMAAFKRQVPYGSVTDSIQEARRLLDRHRDEPFLKGVDGSLVDDFVGGRLGLIGATRQGCAGFPGQGSQPAETAHLGDAGIPAADGVGGE